MLLLWKEAFLSQFVTVIQNAEIYLQTVILTIVILTNLIFNYRFHY